MEDVRAYKPVTKKFIQEEQTATATANAYGTGAFTDGEWYSIHLQTEGESWREDFIELVQSITDRFTAGEWNGDHAAEINTLLADVEERDQMQLMRALAIDAFLANGTAEEIAMFNRLSRYKHNNIEPDGEALKKRGFSNGKHHSFGIFTADYTGKERA